MVESKNSDRNPLCLFNASLQYPVSGANCNPHGKDTETLVRLCWEYSASFSPIHTLPLSLTPTSTFSFFSHTHTHTHTHTHAHTHPHTDNLSLPSYHTRCLFLGRVLKIKEPTLTPVQRSLCHHTQTQT